MEDRNKAIVRRYVDDLWGNGELPIAEEVVSPDVVFRGQTVAIEGIDALKEYVVRFRAAFPKLQYITEHTIAEDDQVVVVLTVMGGPNTGELPVGIGGKFEMLPPTGQSFEVRAVDICRIRNDKIEEIQVFLNAGDMMEQLGNPSIRPPSLSSAS